MDTIPLLLDGYTDLPPGKIANVVTYLEMTAPPTLDPPARTDGLCVRPVANPATRWYREMIRLIGEDWMWVHVPLMPEAKLEAVLRDPAVEIYVVERGRAALGVAELNRRAPGEVEIVMFGVVPDAIGTGAGHHLLQGVLDAAFRADTRRVWLHTCTNDHPAALSFYQRAGFTAFKFAIEVMDDPRLTGAYPETAGARIPIIRPGLKNPKPDE